MPRMRELEAKLVVRDEASFRALGALDRIGRLSVRLRTTCLQQDTYLDTVSLRLYRAGYACRVRRVGPRALVTLKGLGAVAGAIHAREEMELEIGDPSVEAVLRLEEEPGPLVRRLAGGEQVVPLFSLVTERRLSDVGDTTRKCFEMALDRTRFSGPRGETTLLEVELESVDGDLGLLEEAAADLRRRFGLTASGLSKFERGLRWAGIPAPSGQ